MAFGKNLREDLIALERSAKDGDPLFHKKQIFVEIERYQSIPIHQIDYNYSLMNKNCAILKTLGASHYNTDLYFFPWYDANDASPGPGYCIVPKFKDICLTTAAFSGCGLSIFDVGIYRVYVHNSNNNGHVQLQDPSGQQQKKLLDNLENSFNNLVRANFNRDQININNPSYEINGKLTGNIIPITNERRSDYDYLNYIRLPNPNMPKSYSSVIHQDYSGNIKAFFFPVEKFGRKINKFFPEGNVLIEFWVGNPRPHYY